jgi:hypothetical protein
MLAGPAPGAWEALYHPAAGVPSHPYAAFVDDWLVGLIGAAGAVGGSAVTGVVAYRLAGLEGEARGKEELRVALAAYGAARDRLSLQIDQLLRAHGIEEDWTARLIACWRSLDWLMGRLSVAMIGRGAMRAIDEVITATNRLPLVAPDPVLESMDTLSELIGGFDPAGSDWRKEWQGGADQFRSGLQGAVVTYRRGLAAKSVCRNMSPTPPNTIELD